MIKRVFLVILIALFLVLVFVSVAQAVEPPGVVYVPYSALSCMNSPDGQGGAVTTLTAGQEYPVLEAPNADPLNAWVLITAQGRTCWAVVQQGYHVYGMVRFNLGIIYPH